MPNLQLEKRLSHAFNMSEPLKTENKVVEQPQVEEKNIVEHIDNKNAASINEIDEKDGVHRELDQFGAWAKSDPREIALVKKLDMYIMASEQPLLLNNP